MPKVVDIVVKRSSLLIEMFMCVDKLKTSFFKRRF